MSQKRTFGHRGLGEKRNWLRAGPTNCHYAYCDIDTSWSKTIKDIAQAVSRTRSMDGISELGWQPLTTCQMPPEVRKQWEAESPDGSVIRDWIIMQIEAQLRLGCSLEHWT